MGRVKVFGLLAVALLMVGVIAAGCSTTSSSGGGIGVLGYFSYPNFTVMKNMSVNHHAIGGGNEDVATGEVVTDATVTVKNDTTGVSTVAAYNAIHGSYMTQLDHSTGESVSVTIVADGTTITGASTATPNSSYTISSPTSGATASLPVTVTWQVSGSQAATHTMVNFGVYQSQTTWESYWEVVPISQTSYTIDSSKMGMAGQCYVYIYGVSSMGLSNAASGSMAYVGSTGTSGSTYFNIP